MKYEVVIGLEVHAELLTQSKIFCSSSAHFGGDPNTHVCPVCLGMPGVLPVLNREVVELALRAALATHCEVARESKFDRKNYFYPDLPKGYQVSQFDQPIGKKGWLEIEVDGQKKRVGITRIHMEEDAGKLVHAGADRLAGSTYSLADYNRAGVPLIEIVGEPDIRTPAEAKAYLAELRNVLLYAGVCDGKMEEGSLRCDANISLRPFGQEAFGKRAEIKNVNSLRSLQRALEYEIQRQAALLDNGEAVVQETRLWDENAGVTRSMRGKEEAHDYRYFPEPDLVMLVVDEAWLKRVQDTLPELPPAKRARYTENWGLTAYEAEVLVDSPELSRLLEGAVAKGGEPKAVTNWLMGDVAAYLNDKKVDLAATRLNVDNLVDLVKLVAAGTINRATGREVLWETMETGKAPSHMVEERGLVQIADESALASLIEQVLARHPAQVQEFLSGKEKVLGFLMGQVMRESKGRAKADLVNQLLLDKLKKIPISKP